MTPKQVLLKIKGMQRDLSDSSFRNDYAYENKNIRITADSDNGLLSVTTEKSTKKILDLAPKIKHNELSIAVYDLNYNQNSTLNYVIKVTSSEPVASDIRIYYRANTEKRFLLLKKGETEVSREHGTVIPGFIDNDNNHFKNLRDDSYLYTLSYPNEIGGSIGDSSDENLFFKQIIIGTAEVSNNVVLFTVADSNIKTNKILLLQETDSYYSTSTLYSGDLNFSTAYPIEPLVDIENENIQKVYWVDGINQPRVINIKGEIDPNDPKQFDFVQEINGGNISVEQSETSGQFPAGVIQYAFTYFNKYGAESAVVDVSPIYYIANSNKGAEPNEIVSKSFKVTLSNLDNDWDYCRIYSIIRTSLNTTPEVRKVIDLKLNEVSTFIDTGASGEYIAPTDLLYKGGEVLSASTITSKDNTLFLGNLETKNSGIISDELVNNLRGTVKFKFETSTRKSYKIGERPIHMSGDFNSNDNNGQFYTYYNHLKQSNRDITTFKYGETYRIGIQLQDIYGKWSNPIYLGDYTNECVNGTNYRGSTDEYAGITITTGNLEVSDRNIISTLKEVGYIKIRPVIVYPEENDRSVLCQGILCPTVFNVKDRMENGPHSQSSWFVRPNLPTILLKDGTGVIDPENENANIDGEIESDQNDNNYFKESGIWANSEHYSPIGGCKTGPNQSAALENNAEFPFSFLLKDVQSLSLNENQYFVDQHIVTLHSPEIEFGNSINNEKLSNYKLRIIGYTPITSSNSNYSIEGINQPTLNTKPYGDGNYYTGTGEFKSAIFRSYNKSRYGFRHLINSNLFLDFCKDYPYLFDSLFTIFPWNYSDHTHKNMSESEDIVSYFSTFKLNKVRTSNYLFSSNNRYFNDGISVNTPITPIAVNKIKEVAKLGNKFYYSNIDKLHSVNIDKEYYVPVNVNNLNDTSLILPSPKSAVYMQPFTRNVTASLKNIPITYRSTDHIVLQLPSFTSPYEPDVEYEYNLYGNYKGTDEEEQRLFWNTDDENTLLKRTIPFSIVKPEDIQSEYGFLLLGELYRDIDNEVIFGGKSDYAIQNNLWVPCGQAVDISDRSISLLYTEGDTYYQRYDHIKTLPRNDQDLNGVTSVISFMCETRINLDGKYSERELYMEKPDLITEEKFNQINTVYSQKNNFFNYRILDSERYGFNNLPNTIAWTKTKHANAIIDEWLNINLASSIDLDGGKGKVTALKKFNDNIVAFQNKGISTVLFNSRVQITPSDNIPIEIANSGKVDGYRYISDKVGCFNKYSICESPNGIYFIDDYNKSLYAFSGELNNISDSKGFHSFMRNNCKLNIWNPKDFNNVVTYRDPINKEVMFIYNDKCLVYNETLGEFSSFYSYDKVPFVFTLNDNVILAKDGKLHIKNGGDTYGEFFGKIEDSYVEYIVNDNPTYDKIFSTVDMRADVLDSNNKLVLDNDTLIKPFNYLKASNEYQESISNLEGKEFIPKFRTWRAQFPRVGKDRIRNNWIRLKIGNMGRTNFNHKVRLHDVVVNYFI